MVCEMCGRPMARKSARHRFCSSSCRQRAHRGGPVVSEGVSGDLVADGEVTALCRRHAARTGWAGTDLAEALERVAAVFDDPRTRPGDLVSLSRQIQSTQEFMSSHPSASLRSVRHLR